MRRAIFASTLALLLSAPAAAQEDVGAAVEAICCGAECCLIGGTCFGRGDLDPADSCQMCDPSSSQTAFTAVDGCGEEDAGPPPADAGSTTPPADAGSTTPPADDGGCSVGATGSAAPLALLALVGGLAVFRRRRQR